jgi:hypothetical protein
LVLREEFAEVHKPFAAVTAVARCGDCSVFADLMWPPFDESDMRRVIAEEDPGVILESPRRVVVVQRIGGELRYYAGGWCLEPSRIYLEQDRVWAEGSEQGTFATVADAVAFAEWYLAAERAFCEIPVLRQVRWLCCPETGDAVDRERGRAQ